MYKDPSTDDLFSVCALWCTILVHFFRISQGQFICFFIKLHFLHVELFSSCTFLLHHFYVALFCILIIPYWTFFRVALCLCIALFHLALLHFAMFLFCSLLLLHSLHVAIFSVALYSCCTISRGVVRNPTNI